MVCKIYSIHGLPTCTSLRPMRSIDKLDLKFFCKHGKFKETGQGGGVD